MVTGAYAATVRAQVAILTVLGRQASALKTSPGARAYYDQQRARELGHAAALRQVANRLVGILHRGLKHRTLYDEATAWAHHIQEQQTQYQQSAA